MADNPVPKKFISGMKVEVNRYLPEGMMIVGIDQAGESVTVVQNIGVLNMSGIQKKNEREQEKQELPSADLGYEIPDTSGLTKRLDDARIANLQREHQAEEEEDEKDEKNGGERRKKRPKKTVGQICFCMNPSCRIGEFIEVERDVE